MFAHRGTGSCGGGHRRRGCSSGGPGASQPWVSSRVRPGSHEPALVREDDELDAVAGAELGQEAPDVRLHRRLGHEQRRADLGVRRAARDLQQHRVLAVGQRLQARVRRRAREAVGDLLEQPPRGAGRDDGVAGRHRADRGEQLLRLGVLEQEAARAGADGREDVLVEVEGREHHHARRRVAVALDEVGGRGDAVEAGHADVHEDDVRGRDAERLQRVAAVAGLAHDGHVGLGVDDEPEACAHERLVVDEEDADHGWDRRLHLEAALRPGTGAQRAAARLDALAHAREAAPAAVGEPHAPSPSSRTTRVTARGSQRSSSDAAAPGPACLSTLVSASWATR